MATCRVHTADGRVVLLVPEGELVTDETNNMIEDAFAKTIESAPGGADQARILSQAAGLTSAADG